MGSSRALSRACISQCGRYMLPRGPANAAVHAHRDSIVAPPRDRLHHGRAPNIRRDTRHSARPPAKQGAIRPIGRHVAAGAVLSMGCPLLFFDLGGDGEGVIARIFQAVPRVADRGGTGSVRPRDDGEALWGALCLSCGTSPERIAPESLTRSVSD